MLVLVRKLDESIIINGDVTVTVLGIEGDRVKIGIEAPRAVSVLRRELCEEVGSQNRAAVESSIQIRKVLPSLQNKLAGRLPSRPKS